MVAANIMLRRNVLIAFGAVALAPGLLHAQQRSKARHIGILSPFHTSSDAFRQAIEQRLRELGYVEGRNIVIEYRPSDGRVDQLPQLATELVKRNVDVIVTTSAAGVQAAKQATATIPIIMAGVDDPIGQ